MNPVDQIRATFGLMKDGAVADLCGVKKSTVSDWRTAAKIPPKHLIELQRRAIQENRELPPILDPGVAEAPHGIATKDAAA